MFVAKLLSAVLLAASALAAPKGGLSERVARRADGTRLTRPVQLIEQTDVVEFTNVSHPSYSSNWAGAVLSTSAGTWRSVTGTFTVPTPRAPSGGYGTYSASAWVGIDGDTCDNAILQTGVDFTVSGGSVSYDAWYEWYPDYAYDFSGISFHAGDRVEVTVTATSTRAGTARIENLSTGQTVTQSITSSYALCEQDAEWIVEDYEENGGLVPFADFGTVTFTGASARRSSGSTGPSGATIIDIEQNGRVLTSVSTSSSSVTVEYV